MRGPETQAEEEEAQNAEDDVNDEEPSAAAAYLVDGEPHCEIIPKIGNAPFSEITSQQLVFRKRASHQETRTS